MSSKSGTSSTSPSLRTMFTCECVGTQNVFMCGICKCVCVCVCVCVCGCVWACMCVYRHQSINTVPYLALVVDIIQLQWPVTVETTGRIHVHTCKY